MTDLAAVAIRPGARVFGAAHRYVQGPGVLDDLGIVVASLGGGPVTVVVDAGVADLLEDRLATALSAGPTRIVRMRGEVTHDAIDAMVGTAADAAIVVGVGGGKTLDLARAVSWRSGARFVAAPTTASNDSPAAMAVAVYDDQHRMIEVIQTGRNPDVVLVDTLVIAAAPPRLFAAGIGDAVAKMFEARSCAAVGGANQMGTPPLRLAGAVATCCYETLREFAPRALASVHQRRADEDVEATVEAMVLMSALAFENGGLSIAHSFVRGLQAVPETADALHGEHVAHGLLVQCALEGESDAFLLDLMDFLRATELPTSLADLGLADPTPAQLRTMSECCVASPHRHKTPADATADSIESAIWRVESLARSRGES